MTTGARVWSLVGALFLVMAVAWATLFHLANKADVQSVPLVRPAPR